MWHPNTRLRLRPCPVVRLLWIRGNAGSLVGAEMVYYVLLSSLLLLVMILEWVGTLIHANDSTEVSESSSDVVTPFTRFGRPATIPPCDPPPLRFNCATILQWFVRSPAARFLRTLPHLGDTAFVVFVAIAIYLPSSHFGVVLFCLGITKFLFPEIILHMWKAFEVTHKREPSIRADPPGWMEYSNRPDFTLRGGPSGSYTPGSASTMNKADDASMTEVKALVALRRGIMLSTAGGLRSANIDSHWVKDDKKHLVNQGIKELANASLRHRTLHKSSPTCADTAEAAEAGDIVEYMEHSPVRHNVGMRVERTFNGFVTVCGGIGLMLHHTSMCMIFAASTLHLHEELQNPLAYEKGVALLIARRFGMGLILVFVLLQHFVAQVVSFVPLRVALLAIIEVFFQWFSIKNMYDVATTVDTVGILGLLVSHYLMAFVLVQDIAKGVGLFVQHIVLLSRLADNVEGARAVQHDVKATNV